MNVRRAVPGDEGRLRDLRLLALTDSPTAFASTYEREAARSEEDWRLLIGSGATFFVEGAESVDGFAGAGPDGVVAVHVDKADPTVVRLVSMWLRPEARGTGAADELMRAALVWAGEQRVRAVRLCVIKGNVAARRVYERHGFGLIDACVPREPDELTELHMERPLTS
ncbi:MAG: GNAT family N-acetyltransferase [Acidimicrobiales bacterium]